MKYRIYGLLAVGLGTFLAAAPLIAHHEIAAKFDDKKPVTLKGTVEEDRQKNKAEKIAKKVSGVKSVDNELKISRP